MAAPFRTDRVRLVVLLRKREDITKEAFSRYWSGSHAELFQSLNVVKQNVLKYEQAHTNDKFLKASEAMGLRVPDWDGMVVLEGESYEKLFAVFLSDEYRDLVGPDEANFLDRPRCQILPLDLLTLFDKT